MNFQRALKAHQEGKLDEAKKFYLLDLSSGLIRYESIFNLALLEFKKGNFKNALYYFNEAIKINANDFVSHANAGICSQKSGDFLGAENFFKNAINIDEKKIQIYAHLADVMISQGKVNEAILWLQKANEIEPENTDILANIAIFYTGENRYSEAVIYYEKLISLSPDHVIGRSYYAITLFELGRYEESLEQSDMAIKLDSKYSNGHLARGLVLHKLQRFNEANMFYLEALRLDPNSLIAQLNISSIKISTVKTNEDISEAIHESEKSCKLIVLNNKLKGFEVKKLVPLFRLKHDVQQANFLHKNGISTPGILEFLEKIPVLYKEYENENGQYLITIIDNNLEAYRHYGEEQYIYKPPKIMNVLNTQLDWSSIEENYLSSTPQMVYIDNFLTKQALTAFQEFSLYSKVWKKEYKGSYLGAFANQGFISPLHMELALELMKVMPKIFRNQSIGQIWGFKYDAKLGSGINVHADFAQVNLNFWITPTSCNLDPFTGGLKIYTVPAPKSWTFADYNRNSDQIYEYLNIMNSKSMTVPYQENRAVLFNSALFHETDKINFDEGYEKRRVNMTYLFGNQLS